MKAHYEQENALRGFHCGNVTAAPEAGTASQTTTTVEAVRAEGNNITPYSLVDGEGGS